MEAVSSSTEEGIPQASSSQTRRPPRRRARSASSICRLGIERSDGIIVIYHLLGHRVAFECHPATTPSIGAVSGVWRGRMPGGLKPDSHRVSMWVLSCVMDFPVSDAPRNTAGAALHNTSAAGLVFDADRATHGSRARHTAGAANSAGAALVLNAVRATHEPSARKRGASAMNGEEDPDVRDAKHEVSRRALLALVLKGRKNDKVGPSQKNMTLIWYLEAGALCATQRGPL